MHSNYTILHSIGLNSVTLELSCKKSIIRIKYTEMTYVIETHVPVSESLALMFPWIPRSSYRCLLLLLILFLIPGVVMIIAYGLISRELYSGMQFEVEQKRGHSGGIRFFQFQHHICLIF